MGHMKKLTHVFEQHGKETELKSEQIQVDGIFCIIHMDNKTESCNRSVYTKTN